MSWHGVGLGFLPMFVIWLFWATIVAVAVILIVRLLGGSSASPPGRAKSDAEEILKQRYARGELTREQYDEMLEHIRR